MVKTYFNSREVAALRRLYAELLAAAKSAAEEIPTLPGSKLDGLSRAKFLAADRKVAELVGWIKELRDSR
jgi:hypothetical protein